MSYLKLGKEEGAELLRRSEKMLEGDLAGGYYIQPNYLFKGHNKMRFSRRNFDLY
jgi:aldehyde dehydrogenase